MTFMKFCHLSKSKDYHVYRSLCVSASYCVSQLPKQWCKVNFDPPPTSWKPVNRFWWNVKLRTIFWRLLHMQNLINDNAVGGLGEYPVWDNKVSCFVFWSLHHVHRSHWWTDFDGLYIRWRFSTQGCPFGVLVDTAVYLRFISHKKPKRGHE